MPGIYVCKREIEITKEIIDVLLKNKCTVAETGRILNYVDSVSKIGDYTAHFDSFYKLEKNAEKDGLLKE